MGLAQQWDQLNQLGMRIKHNLEQQIQARNQSGVSEDALKEFSMMFRHFDKDKSGRLNHNEFKSCLRALGKTVIYEIIYLLLSIRRCFTAVLYIKISVELQDTTYLWLTMESQSPNLRQY